MPPIDPKGPYRGHRERFLQMLDREDAFALVFSGSPVVRNHDCDHRFRPTSDFWYLTGFAEPEAALVLAPRHSGAKSVLFLRERVPEEETWTGRRLGLDAAPEALGVEEARPIGDLWDDLPDLLEDHTRMISASAVDPDRDRSLLDALTVARHKTRNGGVVPTSWEQPTHTLHELRLKKSAAELERVRKAVELTTAGHVAVMAAAKPGTNECTLDALLEHTFRAGGSTGAAYTNIVAGGDNACILHYVENDRPLQPGSLCLVDAGAEWEYYASDVTRTFPVDGTFTDDQRRLYEVVLRAQKAAIDEVRPGSTMQKVHERALHEICEGLLELGIVQGTVDSVIADGTYRPFFMHKSGHWLGLDVHDCGAYFVDREPRPLEPDMIVTVEPGIYVDPAIEGVDPRWSGMGIRIEDDVLVTRDGNENLTAAIPKEVDEVEAACQGATLETAAR